MPARGRCSTGSLADVVCQPRYAAAMGLVMEGVPCSGDGAAGARDAQREAVFRAHEKAWFEKQFLNGFRAEFILMFELFTIGLFSKMTSPNY